MLARFPYQLGDFLVVEVERLQAAVTFGQLQWEELAVVLARQETGQAFQVMPLNGSMRIHSIFRRSSISS